MRVFYDIPVSFYNELGADIVVHCEFIEEYESVIRDFASRAKFFTANNHESNYVEPQLEIKDYVELISGYTPEVFVVPQHIGDYGLSAQLMKEFFEVMIEKKVLDKYTNKPIAICPLEGDNINDYINFKRLYHGVISEGFTKIYGLNGMQSGFTFPFRKPVIDYMVATTMNSEALMFHLLGYDYPIIHRNVISMNTTHPFTPVLFKNHGEQNISYYDIDSDKVSINTKKELTIQLEIFNSVIQDASV